MCEGRANANFVPICPTLFIQAYNVPIVCNMYKWSVSWKYLEQSAKIIFTYHHCFVTDPPGWIHAYTYYVR